MFEKGNAVVHSSTNRKLRGSPSDVDPAPRVAVVAGQLGRRRWELQWVALDGLDRAHEQVLNTAERKDSLIADEIGDLARCPGSLE